MDDYLWDMTSMEEMLLDAFQNDELGDGAHIMDTLFESLKFASTTPLFGPLQLVRKFWHVECMFLNNIEVVYLHDRSSSLYFEKPCHTINIKNG